MKIKDVILGIAIIVLTIFVAFYGINTLFPKPNYDDFCRDISGDIYNDQASCEANGGRWNNYVGPKSVDERGNVINGYCDMYYYCNQDFNDLLKERGKKVFFVALPLGIVIIALGAFVFGLEAVGAGLMGGGVGTLIYGSGAYWPYTQNWVRFLLSLIGLVILIWLTYYFNKRLGKHKHHF